MRPRGGAEGCTSADALRAAVDGAGAALVHARVLPMGSMFPGDLVRAAAELPLPVSCVVATPAVIARATRKTAVLGETLVFGRGQLLGRVEPGLADPVARARGLIGAGVAPWLSRTAEDDEPCEADEDPFSVIGVGRMATFDEVHAAWRRRLAEYHPDRYATAGDKIRRLAHTETQRLNAAYAALLRGRRP